MLESFGSMVNMENSNLRHVSSGVPTELCGLQFNGVTFGLLFGLVKPPSPETHIFLFVIVSITEV